MKVKWRIGKGTMKSPNGGDLCRIQLLVCRLNYFFLIWVGKERDSILLFPARVLVSVPIRFCFPFSFFPNMKAPPFAFRGWWLSIYIQLHCNLAVHKEILRGCISGIVGCIWHIFQLLFFFKFFYVWLGKRCKGKWLSLEVAEFVNGWSLNLVVGLCRNYLAALQSGLFN